MIDHSKFLEWAYKSLRNVKDGSEITANSIFTDDNKRKLYCNTDKNVYHCFKSENSGSLYKLVSIVEKCTYEEAVEILGGNKDFHSLEQKINDIFNKEKKATFEQSVKISVPPGTYLINELSDSNPIKIKATDYLKSRKVNNPNLMVCVYGNYANRIIIPYYNEIGDLIYWNARALGDSNVKYIVPKNVGVGKGDVIYFPSWPTTNKVYLCEGEFNALSLSQLNLQSGACGGKEISNEQHDILNNYDIVICFDNDKAGINATYKKCKALKQHNMYRIIKYVFPPVEYNDWNEYYINQENNVFNFIINNEKLFDEIKYQSKYYKELTYNNLYKTKQFYQSN